ncbi:hypothetical protein J6590_054079 [Homalodisca vitripennis]|nr:hypothetical protein J6590_054079 [Homalodisca vitripennis]
MDDVRSASRALKRGHGRATYDSSHYNSHWHRRGTQVLRNPCVYSTRDKVQSGTTTAIELTKGIRTQDDTTANEKTKSFFGIPLITRRESQCRTNCTKAGSIPTHLGREKMRPLLHNAASSKTRIILQTREQRAKPLRVIASGAYHVQNDSDGTMLGRVSKDTSDKQTDELWDEF